MEITESSERMEIKLHIEELNDLISCLSNKVKEFEKSVTCTVSCVDIYRMLVREVDSALGRWY